MPIIYSAGFHFFLRQIVNENDRPLLVGPYEVEHGGKFDLSQQEPIGVVNN